MTIKVLVLSGGGGRGAFHAGVYKYLMQAQKSGVDRAHQGTWIPDVVLGTSIGAVNGAAITQGMSAEALEQFWLSLRERDVQGIPPGMGFLARWVVKRLLRSAIGASLPVIPREKAFSPEAEDSWPPLPLLPRWLSTRLIGRWNNLLDTAPLYETMIQRIQLDEQKIAESKTRLIISATNVRTGEGALFSNRPMTHRRTKQNMVQSPITGRRIIASCSIPMVYPWTKDTDGQLYWDGAVVANTPLSPAFDAVQDQPIEEIMEAVIVMMTPWWETNEAPPSDARLPQDFGEALTFTLDWALLASFRTELKSARTFSRMAREAVQQGKPMNYRIVQDIIVAPEQFLPVTRIIDYDEAASRMLIDQGYQAAERAFRKQFSLSKNAGYGRLLASSS
jgi:NTE family protein